MDKAGMRGDSLLPDHSFSVAVLQPMALKAHPEMGKLKPAKRRRPVSPFLCPLCELFYVLAIRPSPCSSGAPKTDRVWFGLETPPILELFNSPEHPYTDVWAALKWGWSLCVFLVFWVALTEPLQTTLKLSKKWRKAVTLHLWAFFFRLHLPCSASGGDRHTQGGFDWPHPGADSWEPVPAWASRALKAPPRPCAVAMAADPFEVSSTTASLLIIPKVPLVCGKTGLKTILLLLGDAVKISTLKTKIYPGLDINIVWTYLNL